MIQNVLNFFKNRKRFGVFVLCLLMASVAWVLVILGKTYTTQLRFPVTYINEQTNYLLHTNETDSVLVEVKGSGFNLLRSNFINKHTPIVMYLNTLLNTTNEIELNLNTDPYLATINAQLPYGLSIVRIQPNVIHFTLRKKHSKRVPVKFSALLSYAPKFFITEAVTIQPKTVVLYGDSIALTTINEVRTENFTQKNLQANVAQTLAIQLPEGIKNVSINVEKVNVSIKIEEFTEAQFILPVQVTNVPDKKIIKTFPDKVPITCLIPLSKFKQITAVDFGLIADYAQELNNENSSKSNYNNKLKLTLNKQPSYVRNVKLSTEKVEFIYKNNVR
jgi:YbbR domain-containing protein